MAALQACMALAHRFRARRCSARRRTVWGRSRASTGLLILAGARWPPRGRVLRFALLEVRLVFLQWVALLRRGEALGALAGLQFVAGRYRPRQLLRLRERLGFTRIGSAATGGCLAVGRCAGLTRRAGRRWRRLTVRWRAGLSRRAGQGRRCLAGRRRAGLTCRAFCRWCLAIGRRAGLTRRALLWVRSVTVGRGAGLTGGA